MELPEVLTRMAIPQPKTRKMIRNEFGHVTSPISVTFDSGEIQGGDSYNA